VSFYPLARDVGSAVLQRSGWSAPRRRLRGKLSIATFHRVLSEAERAEYPLPDLAVTPEELARILESLASEFSCGTLQEAMERWTAGDDPERPLLAITFDDGQLDNVTRAVPVLDALGLKASFFVVSAAAESGQMLWHDRIAFALASATRRDLSAAQTALAELSPESPPDAREVARVVELAKQRLTSAAQREVWIRRLENALGTPPRPAWDGMLRFTHLQSLREAGHEIGSHSFSHPLLPQCSDLELAQELAESKRQLEREVGGTVTSFCYPNGSWDARVLEATRRADYARAVTTQHGWNARGAEPLALRRCDLTYAHCVDRHGHFSPARLALRLGRTGT